MDTSPKGWIDQLVGLCFGILVGALALYGAVLLIEAIWLWLVLGAGLLLIVVGAVALLRGRPGSW